MPYNQEFLEHYGIKGMRWGVRRKKSGGSSSSKPAKKSWSEMNQKEREKLVNRRAKQLVAGYLGYKVVRGLTPAAGILIKGGAVSITTKNLQRAANKRANVEAAAKKAEAARKAAEDAINWLDLSFSGSELVKVGG